MLVVATGDARAQSAANGAALYANTNNAPLSCNNSACHGTNPAANKNKIANGASATKISSAISKNTGGMGFLSAYCDATCAADIAAYITNPAGAAAPVASASPTSLVFAGTTIGASASAQTVTLRNTGAASLSLSGIAIAGSAAADYSRGGTCAAGGSVAAGASCTLNVTFTPGAAGTRAASLSVSHNATGSPTMVALSGTGNAANAPSISVSASALSFASTVIGSPSAAQTLTVTNSGAASLTLASFTFGGANAADFARTGGSCVGSLAAGANCTVDVLFTPAALGTRAGNLVITSNASNGNPSVALAGTGQQAPAPIASMSASSIVFGSIAIGNTASQSFTLTNTGNASLTITSIARTGSAGFAVSGSTCGSTLAAGTTCTVTVAFNPAAAGAVTGTVTITDDAAASPRSIALSGTGVATPIGMAQLSSAAPLVFAPTDVGQSSAVQTLTLNNVGNAALNLASLALAGTTAGDFSLGGTCAPAASIPAGQSCMLSVTFTPTAAGPRSARVDLTTSTGTTLTVVTSGQGNVVAAATAALTPATIDFGTVDPASPGAARTVTITNTGTLAVLIQSVTLTGPFASSAVAGNSVASVSTTASVSPASVSPACPAPAFTLQPAASCTWSVAFAATQAGTATGELAVTTGAGALLLKSTLSATATVAPAAAGPVAAIQPTNLGVGGCTVASVGTPDPTLPALALLSLVILAIRRRQPAAGPPLCGNTADFTDHQPVTRELPLNTPITLRSNTAPRIPFARRALACSFVLGLAAQPAAAVQPGQPSPAYSLSGPQGLISNAEMKGQLVYVDFWASWCGPCRKSFPWMNEMQQKYGAQGLKIVAINVDANPEDAKKFLAGNKADFRVAFDAKGETPKSFAIKGMPSSVLVGPDGKVIAVHAGFRDEDKAALEEAIRQALPKK